MKEARKVYRELDAWLVGQPVPVRDAGTRVLMSLAYCYLNPPDDIGRRGLLDDVALLRNVVFGFGGTA